MESDQPIATKAAEQQRSFGTYARDVFGKSSRPGVNLGTRLSLADIGQTIAQNFAIQLTAGTSFLQMISATD